MDTNSRQNTSKQMHSETKAGGARILTGSHASRARANSAVNAPLHGTAKEQATFISTWKEASHTWRAKAVLCFFLAALLVTMQPSGNALYRTWNPNTGETMGLAVAVDMVTAGLSDSGDQGDGEPSNGLVPGQIISTPDGDESSGDDESNLMAAAAQNTVTLKAKNGTFTVGTATGLTTITITNVPGATTLDNIKFGDVVSNTAEYSESGAHSLESLTKVPAQNYTANGVWEPGENDVIISDRIRSDVTLTYVFMTDAGYAAYTGSALPNDREGKIHFYGDATDEDAPKIMRGLWDGLTTSYWTYSVESGYTEQTGAFKMKSYGESNDYMRTGLSNGQSTEPGRYYFNDPDDSSEPGAFAAVEGAGGAYGAVKLLSDKTVFDTGGSEFLPSNLYWSLGMGFEGWVLVDPSRTSSTGLRAVYTDDSEKGYNNGAGYMDSDATKMIYYNPYPTINNNSLPSAYFVGVSPEGVMTTRFNDAKVHRETDTSGEYWDVRAYAVWAPRAYELVMEMDGDELARVEGLGWNDPVDVDESFESTDGTHNDSWIETLKGQGVTWATANYDGSDGYTGNSVRGISGHKFYDFVNMFNSGDPEVDPWYPNPDYEEWEPTGVVRVHPFYSVQFLPTLGATGGTTKNFAITRDPGTVKDYTGAEASSSDYPDESTYVFPYFSADFKSWVEGHLSDFIDEYDKDNDKVLFVSVADFLTSAGAQQECEETDTDGKYDTDGDGTWGETEYYAFLEGEYSFDVNGNDSDWTTSLEESSSITEHIGYVWTNNEEEGLSSYASGGSGFMASAGESALMPLAGLSSTDEGGAGLTAPKDKAGNSYKFLGWSETEQTSIDVQPNVDYAAGETAPGTKPVLSAGQTITGSKTLYAVWGEDKTEYDITIEDANGTFKINDEIKNLKSIKITDVLTSTQYRYIKFGDDITVVNGVGTVKFNENGSNDIDSITKVPADATLKESGTWAGGNIAADSNPATILASRTTIGGSERPAVSGAATLTFTHDAAACNITWAVSDTALAAAYNADGTDAPATTANGGTAFSEILAGASVRAKDDDATEGFRAKYGSASIAGEDLGTDEYTITYTDGGAAVTGSTIDGDVTITLKPKVATYTVTLAIGNQPQKDEDPEDSTKWTATSGQFANGVPTIVYEVPYGTAYNAIYYKAGTDDYSDAYVYAGSSDENKSEKVLTAAAVENDGAKGWLGAKGTGDDGAWSGSWDNLTGTVSCDTTLTYTYEQGMVGIVYAKGPLTVAPENTENKDLSDSTLTQITNMRGHNGTVTTDGSEALPTGVTAADIQNSKNYEVIYVPWNTNTKTIAQPGGTDDDKFPMLSTAATNKYVAPFNTGGEGSNSEGRLNWGDQAYPEDGYLVDPTYVFVGTPVLNTFNVTVEVHDATGTHEIVGHIVDAEGKTIDSKVVGTVAWGDKVSSIEDLVSSSFLTSRVKSDVDGAYDISTAKWAKSPDDGTGYLGDPSSYTTPITTGGTTFTVFVTPQTYTVTVNTEGGYINGENGKSTGTDAYTFDITDVPYGTDLATLHYNKNTHEWAEADENNDDIIPLNGDDATTKTPATGKTTEGATWAVNNGTPAAALDGTVQDDTTVDYSFGGTYSVKLKVNNGTLGSGDSAKDTITITNVPQTAKVGTIHYAPFTAGATTTEYSTATGSKALDGDLNANEGYTPKADTPWSIGTDEYANIAAMNDVAVTNGMTIEYTYVKATYTVTVSIINPKTGAGDTNTTYNGHTGNSFTIAGVPFETAFSAIEFNWDDANGTQGTWAENGSQTLKASPTTGTDGIGGDTKQKGAWNAADADTLPVNGATYTFTYSEDSYTVTYEVASGNGSWASGIVAEKSGYKYNDTIAATGTGDDKTPASLGDGTLTGTEFSDYITAASGYAKTRGDDDASNDSVKGAWYKKAEGDADFTELGTGKKPEGESVTGNVTYQYRLEPVSSIKLKLDGESVAAWSDSDSTKTDKVYEMFNGEKPNQVGLASGAFDTITGAIVPASGYYKTDTDSNVSSGSWSGTPAFDAAAGNTSTSNEYTYSFKKVDTITYTIENGKFTGEGDESERTQQLFHDTDGETLSAPGTEAFGGEGTTGAWYDGATKLDAAPSGKSTAGDKTYTYKYEEAKDSYTIVPWVQTGTAARNNATEKNAANYTQNGAGFSTVTSGEVTLGRTTVTKDTVVADGKTLAQIVADWEIENGTTFDSTSAGATLDDISFVPTAGNTTINVYLNVEGHTVTLAYTYDGQATAGTGFTAGDGFSADKLTAPTANPSTVYYGESVTLPTETAPTHYSFEGWTATAGTELDSENHIMGATDLTYTGNWERESFNFIFHNPDTNAGTIGGSSESTVTVTKQWKDTLPESEYAPEPKSGSGQSFAGWYASADSDASISNPPDAETPITSGGEYWARWGTDLTITYQAGEHGHFDTQTATIASGTQVPEFTGDVETGMDAGYEFKEWSFTASGEGTVDKTSRTKPYDGITTSAMTFTAIYQGVSHNLNADWDGGAPTDAYKTITGNVADATTTNAVQVRTGDAVPLPSPEQISKFGYTLTSYTVTQGTEETTVNASSATPWAYTVLASGDISVKANYTETGHDITYAIAGVDPDSGVATPNVSALKTEFTAVQSDAAQLVDMTASGDYGVTGHTLQNLTYTARDGSTKTIAAADAATATIPVADLPDGDLVVTANWKVNEYDVTWRLADEYTAGSTGLGLSPKTDTTLDGSGVVTKSGVKYGTTLSSLASSAPDLTRNTAAQAEYDGTIDWATETTGTIVADTVAYVGTPKRNTFSVKVYVTNGYFGEDGTDTSAKDYGEFAYNTNVNTVTSTNVTPNALSELKVRPMDESYGNTPTWKLTINNEEQAGPIADPRDTGTTTKVTGAMVYTAEFATKTYTVQYRLATNLSDAELDATDANDVSYNTTVNGLPSLKWKNASATGSATDKYEITKWEDENGNEVVPGTTKFTDALDLDSDNDGVIVLTATTAIRDYDFKVSVAGGTVKKTDSDAEAGITYETKVPYGTYVKDTLGTLTIAANDGTNTKDTSLWTYTPTVGDNDMVTGNTQISVDIPAFKTITFDVEHGTWNAETASKYGAAGATANSNTGTITIYVPSTKTLDEYYTTSTDATSRAGSFSAPVAVSVGESAGYTDNGNWDKAIVTDVAPTADAAYTYSFEPRDNVPYKVNVYWQNANPGANTPYTRADYSADPDQVVEVDGATFNVATPLAGLLGNVGDARVDGKIEVPAGFVKALADHNAVEGGVVSDTAITVTSVNRDDNVVNVYLDRALVDYDYEWYGSAPVKLPEGGKARYGETKVLQEYPDPVSDKSFLGWKPKNSDTVVPESGYTFTPEASGDGYAKTTFQGEWGAAVYRTTYRLLTAEEMTALAGKLGASFTADEYDTGATMTVDENPWDATANQVRSDNTAGGSAAHVPEVTYSSADQAQYDITGWKYSTDGGETWADGIIESPAKVNVRSNSYVFAPIIQTHVYTVKFTAGEYGKPLEEVEGVTVFALKYGADLPKSPWVDALNEEVGYNGGENEALDANNQLTSSYAKKIGLNGSGDVEVSTNYSRAYRSAAQQSDNGNRSNWETSTEDAAKILSGNKVGGDITYSWKFAPQTYTVHFMNIEGSNIAKSDIDAVDSSNTVNLTGSLINESGGGKWNGGWSGMPNTATTADYDNLVYKNIQWEGDGSNIFLNMSTDKFLNKLPQSEVDGKKYDAWTYPTKPGAKFTGWVTGSSTAPANATPKTPGTDFISVSSIAPAENFEGDTSNKQDLFVWATWEYDTATLNFHNNVTGSYTQPYNGTLHIDETVAVPPIANLGSDFNPAGYEFKGWYDNAEFTGTAIADNGNYKLTAAQNDLYAKYEANTFNIQYRDFNGNMITVAQAKDAGIITSNSQSAQGFQNDDSIFTQPFVYGSDDSKLDAKMATLVAGAGHNDNGKTFSKWYHGEQSVVNGTIVGSATLEKDDTVKTLSATKGETIILWPMEAKEYKLTVDPGNGDATSTTSKAVEQDGANAGKSVFTLPAAPSKEGFTFGGWTVNGTTYDAGSEVVISADSNATAVWSAATDTGYKVTRHYQSAIDDAEYTVTADDADTTGKTGDTAKPDTAVPSTLPSGVPAGYTSDAYELDTSKTKATTAEIAADGKTQIDLYYKIKTYTVTYTYMNAPSGSQPERTKDADIAWGTEITLPSTHANLPAGYDASTKWQELSGASFVDVGDSGDKVTVTKNMSLFAVIGAAKHTVKFELGAFAEWESGTPADSLLTQEVTHNANPNISGLDTKAAPDDGDMASDYVFVGWTSSATGTVVSLPEPVTQDVTYTASWRKINAVSYSLGDHASKAASDSAKDAASKVDYTGLPQNFAWSEADFNLADSSATDAKGNPTAEAGWEFDKWVDQDGNTYTDPADIAAKLDGKTTQNYTFTATYKATEQTVDFKTAAGEQGAVSTADESVTKATGQKVTVPAAPDAKPGYEFKGWVGELDGNPVRLYPGGTFDMPATPAAPAKTTLTAEYERQKVDIGYSSEDNAKGTVSTSGSSVDAADENSITVKAQPNPGYAFSKWTSANNPTKDLSGDYTEDGTLTVPRNGSNIYEADSYVAEFVENPYQVKFENAADEDKHSSKFDVDYRTGKDYQEVKRNENPLIGGDYGVKLDVQAETGYTFQGWNYTMKKESLDPATGELVYTTETSAVPVSDPSKVTILGDTTFTAYYAPDAATVAFVSDSSGQATGTVSPISNKHTGDAVTLPAEGFSWPGHTFLGWSLSSGGDVLTKENGGLNDEGKYVLKGGAEVMYAVWQSQNTTITYHNNADDAAVTWFTGDGKGTEANGPAARLEFTALKVSHIDTVPAATATSAKDISVWASDAKTAANAYWDPNWNGVPGYIASSADKSKVPGHARKFVGWNTRADGQGTTYQAGDTIPATAVPATSEGNLDLFAMWENATFTVTLNSGGGNLKSGAQSIQQKWENVVYGQVITLPAPDTLYEYSHHSFNGWEDNATPESVRSPLFGTASGESTYTFKSATDVTLTAKWNLDAGITANVKVYFHSMNSTPSGASIEPAYYDRRTLEDKPLVDGKHNQVGDLYTYTGWYATNTTAGTAPDEAFTNKYGLGNTVDGKFQFSDDLTVGDIIQKFYNNTQPLRETTNFAGANEPPILYANGDYTDAYRNASEVEIHLYRWADLSKFQVNYNANTPGDADYTGTMATQIIDYKGENQALNANTFKTPGYTFKGWVKSDEKPSTSLPVGDPAGMLADKADISGNKALDLINQTEANAGVTSADLWAMWDVTSNSVEFNLTYDGDGVANGVEGYQGSDFKVSDLVWNTGDSPTRNARIVYPGTAASSATNNVSYATLKVLDDSAYPEPGTADSDKQYAKYTLAGWYTQPNGKGVKVEFTDGVSDKTVKQLVEAMEADKTSPNPVADEQGNYTLQLYAHWTNNGATITYNKNGATGADLQPTVAALGADEDATTDVPLRKNELTKKGYKPNGWSASPDGSNPYTEGIYPYPNNKGGEETPLYAAFTAREYTINYGYDGGTAGVASTTHQPLETQKMGWDDTNVYPNFETQPAKDGYSFGGFKVTTPAGNTVSVTQSWKIQGLAERIAMADHPDWNAVQVASQVDDVFGTADAARESDKAYTFTAIWNAKDYKVNYNLGGASTRNGASPNKTGVHWDDADLLIDESSLTYAGHSDVKWYIDEARTIEVSADNGGNPTFGDIADQLKDEGIAWTNDDTITLYAGWSETKVTIVFKVSDSSIAKLDTINGEETALTQISYTVGASSGVVYNADGTQLYPALPAIVAGATDAGYEVVNWTLNGAEASSNSTIHITGPNGDGAYTNATYIAQVEGKSDIELKVNHHFQNADGTWEDAQVTTETKSSKDFDAKNGDSISKDKLVLGTIPAGFTWDSGRTGDLTVAPGAEADLYYNRTKHTVTYAVAVQGNPSTKPSAPSPKENVLYGSQVALPAAPAAPDGYEFDAWYEGFKSIDEPGTAAADPGTITADKTLTAVYKKIEHEVTLEGVFYEDGSPVQMGNASLSPSPTGAVSIATGSTLKDAGYNLKVTQEMTSGNDQTVVLGADGGTKIADLSFKDTLFISWEYTVGTSDTKYYTDDPTKVPITDETHFKAIASAAQIVMYLPGEHGTFATNKATGTRVEDLTSEEEPSYDLSDYLYGSIVEDYKPFAGPVTEDTESPNYGLPTGEDGWKFKGWYVKYTDPLGLTTDTSTRGTDPETDQDLKDNSDYKNLTRSITLTADWEPTKSNLVFDLNGPAESTISFKEGKDPSGKYATYDGQEKNKIRMPETADTDADGWTLVKWVWETKNSKGEDVTYEYDPASTTFEMPAQKVTDTTTLKAVWAEDYVTYNYYSADTNKGTVTNNPEEVGVWTGKLKGSDQLAQGSVAKPGGSYEFVKWTIGSDDGTVVTENANLTADLLAKDANGKRVAANYYATFKGEGYTVQFAVAEGQDGTNGSEKLGVIKNAAGAERVGAGARQIVEHNGTVDLTAMYAEPTSGNEFADGDYWTYVMYDGHTNDPAKNKEGSATDETLAKMKVTGDLFLTAHFKKGAGQYTVNWHARNTDDKAAITFTTKSGWNDQVSTSRSIKRTGYTFNGWYSSFPVVDAADITNETAPGSTPLREQSYGELAGGEAATDATKQSIDMYAGWVEKRGYSVEFDTNGSSDDNLLISNLKWTATIGTDQVSKSSWKGEGGTQPTWPGHEFVGWYTKAEGGTQVFADADGETYIDLAEGDDDVDNGVKLYAHWTETTYKVRYFSQWGDNGEYKFDETYEYKYEETGLDISSPANPDPANWRWVAENGKSGWVYNGTTDIDVDTNTSVKTLVDQGAVMVDGAYVLNGTWETTIPFQTTYVLYEKDEATGTWNGNQELDVIEDLDLNLTVTGRDWAKSTVRPDTVSWKDVPIYGYTFGDDAVRLTWQELNGGDTVNSSFDDVKVDNFNATDPVHFYVALTMKKPFTLKFDLNDQGENPGGKIGATITAGEDDAETVITDITELYQHDKTFQSVDNTPHDATGNDTYYNDPTRPGFTFDGWHNLPIDTATDENTGDDVTDIQALGDSDVAGGNGNKTKYGDLARLANGDWYEPGLGNSNSASDNIGLTLYAKWIENQREVKYAVASDQMDLLKIKLTRETSDDAYGTDPLTEVIGAASGQVYVQNSNGDFVKNRNATPGATAKAKRGYSIEWKILTELPGKFREVLGSKAGNATVAEDEVELGAASADESNLSAAATEDSANSSEGVNYSSNNVITPAVDESNLFAGSAPAGTNDAGDGEESVLYVATATLNDKVSITFDKGADDATYTGPASADQPWGTYVGETEPWGDNDGKLPAASTISRDGYDFQGWNVPAGTQYVDKNGNTVTLDKDTVFDPTDENANRIIVPENGLKLTAAWKKHEEPSSSSSTKPTPGKNTITIPATVNKHTGKPVPETDIVVDDNKKLTPDQINTILNRGGSTPDKWVITYTGPDGNPVTETLSTNELIKWLQNNPITDDVTIAVADDANWSKTVTTVKGGKKSTSSSKGSSSDSSKSALAKTGDNTLYLAFGLSLLALAAAVVIVTARRRQE